MSSSNTLFKILNPIMKTVLKSPMHGGISSRIMILSFNGRKSGKWYSTPVSYIQEGSFVYCFTHANWWKNISDGADVCLRVQGMDMEGRAVAITKDLDLKSEYLSKMLKAIPSDAVYYQVSMDENGEPDQAEVRKAAGEAVMIKIELTG